MSAVDYRFGPYRLSPAPRELREDGRLLTVPRLVFDGIVYLVEHRDRAIGRDELVSALWGRVDVPEARVSELMARIRRTVGDDGQRQTAVRTVAGFGYRWVAEVEVLAPMTPEAASIASPAPGSLPRSTEGDAVGAQSSDDPVVSPTPPQSRVSVAAPSSASVPREQGPRRASAVVAALIVVAIAIAATAFVVGRRAHAPAPVATAPAVPAVDGGFAVLPLAIDAPLDAAWLRLGAMDLVAERLRGSGLAVAPSESVLLALHGVAGPAAEADPSRALGVGHLVKGSLSLEADGWKAVLATQAGGVQHRVEARHADPVEAARLGSDLLLAALGRRPAAAVETGDVERTLQQVQAAMLADELDTARALLLALPDPGRADPRVRLRLVMIDLRAGRLADAGPALDALIADPVFEADRVLLGKALVVRGKTAFRQARFDPAIADLDRAVDLLRGPASANDRADALATRAAAHLGRHEGEAATRDLGEARLLFEEAGNALGVAQVDTNLGLFEGGEGRLERARDLLHDASARFEAAGAVERLIGVRTALLDIEIGLLRWQDALATAEAQWALRDRAKDPGLATMLLVDRVRTLTGNGRLSEAAATLAAWTAPIPEGPPTYFLAAARAALAWEQGRHDLALADADRALAAWPDDPRDAMRAAVVLLRQRAGGEAGPDAPGPDEAVALLVARAERLAAASRTHDADAAYRAAATAAREHGVPSDLALVATSYVPWLLGAGRVDEAVTVAGLIAPFASQDHDSARLQADVLGARQGGDAWKAAAARADVLAGERRRPQALSTRP